MNGAAPYAVPPSNPFFSAATASDRCPAAGRDSDNCPEIYAWGFRNPWRWSFDRANGDLWLGDVGQDSWEEVNVVERGGNYGWRCREGANDFDTRNTSGCEERPLIDPVTEYDHSNGISVTGGYVYRGSQLTNLAGRYLFADFGFGRIWAWIAENAELPRQPTLLSETQFGISSFAQGNDGELYVVDYGGGADTGTLHRIVFQAAAAGGMAPSEVERDRLRQPIERDATRAGTDPVLDQRSILVRQRAEGALDRAAERPEHHGPARR